MVKEGSGPLRLAPQAPCTLVANARAARNREQQPHKVMCLGFRRVAVRVNGLLRGQRRVSARSMLHTVAWRALRALGVGKGNPRRPGGSVRAHAEAWQAWRVPGVGKGIPRSPGGSARAHAGAWQALRASELGRAARGSPETRIRPRSFMHSMELIGEAFF